MRARCETDQAGAHVVGQVHRGVCCCATAPVRDTLGIAGVAQPGIPPQRLSRTDAGVAQTLLARVTAAGAQCARVGVAVGDMAGWHHAVAEHDDDLGPLALKLAGQQGVDHHVVGEHTHRREHQHRLTGPRQRCLGLAQTLQGLLKLAVGVKLPSNPVGCQRLDQSFEFTHAWK